MSNLLLNIVTSSVVGTILFGMLLLFKPITKRMFSKAWHYYMGFIPVFFLLGGTVIISILIGHIMPQAVNIIEAPIPIELAQGTSTYPVIISDIIVPIYTFPAGQQSQSTVPLTYSVQPAPWLPYLTGYIAMVAPIIAVIWATGAVLFALINIKRYRAYRRLLFQHCQIFETTQSPIPVIITRLATTPQMIGFIKPVIILPKMNFTSHELDIILIHELVHFKRKDMWLKFIVLIARATHWFNPAVHRLSRHINTQCELSVDEKVVIKMDIKKRVFYGETILSILQQGITQKSIYGASALCSSQENIKRRLSDMLNAKKARKIVVALSLVVALMVAGIGSIAAYALRADIDEEYDYNVHAGDSEHEYADTLEHEYTDALEYEYVDDLEYVPDTEECTCFINPSPGGNISRDTDVIFTGDVTYTIDIESSFPPDAIINGNIHITSGGSLTLAGNTQVHGVILIDYGGALTLSGNSYINGTVIVNGIFIMKDNVIITGEGRGVAVNTSGRFYMHSGYIKGNSYFCNGGGVLNLGTFTMFGGYIMYNITGGLGGGVAMNGTITKGHMTMYGGMIVNNRIGWCICP